jgi:hypothetical protein
MNRIETNGAALAGAANIAPSHLENAIAKQSTKRLLPSLTTIYIGVSVITTLAWAASIIWLGRSLFGIF